MHATDIRSINLVRVPVIFVYLHCAAKFRLFMFLSHPHEFKSRSFSPVSSTACYQHITIIALAAV